MSSPFSEDSVVVKRDIPEVIDLFFPLCRYDKLPEKVKLVAPFPSIPLVIIYDTIISLPSFGFFPKMSSPKII